MNSVELCVFKPNYRFTFFCIAFFLILAFTPFLLLPITIIGLIFIGLAKYQKEYNKYIILFSFFASLGMLINVMSIPNFLNQSDDFVTYYNNYLSLYSGDFKAIFQFGGGIEIGLPLINLLLSKIINADYPYVVKFFHCVILLIIYLFVITLIIKKFRLDWKNTSLLIGLLFCFFKLSLAVYFLRQGYSSLFILMGLFVVTPWLRRLCYLIAVLFHSSAIVVIPMIYFLLMVKNKKKHLLFRVCCIIVSIFLWFSISTLSSISFDNVFLQKLNFFFFYLSNEEYVFNSIKSSMVSMLYLIPLLLLMLFSKGNYKSTNNLSIVSIFIFTFSFSFLPSITTRVLMPILTFFIGYLYFLSFNSLRNVNVKMLLMLFSVFSLNINWIFNDALYYYKYPMVSTTPFYYISSNFTSGSTIDRSSLPSQIRIINNNKI